MRDKLDTLNTTVNKVANLNVEWRGSIWKPTGAQLYFPLPAAGVLRWICFQPTYRLNPPQGVLLYEIHEIRRPPVPVPVPVPQDVKVKLKQKYDQQKPVPLTAEAWARQFSAEHPLVMAAIGVLLLVAGIAAAAATIVAILDPVPGDEVAAGAATLWLLRLASISLRIAPATGL